MLRALSFFCLAAIGASIPNAQAVAAPCVVGDYDGGAMEIAAGLQLRAGGRFSYGMSYGALDEQAEGTWETDGKTVFLTSDPITPPRFTLVGQRAAPANEFRLKLELPDGISPQHFNAMAVMKDGRTVGSPLGFEDWVVPLEPGEAVVSVKLLLPVVDLESERFALSPGSATEARFRFEPNDIGKVAFDRTPLRIDGRELLVERHDRQLRFRPLRGGC